MELAEMLRELAGEEKREQSMTALQAEAMAKELTERLSTFNAPNTFKVGDIVCWKPGLKNRKTEYGKPLIVVKILEQPVLDQEKGPGSHYFNEPLDILIGEIMGDGMFSTFHYDSRRLQHYDFGSEYQSAA